MYKFYIPPKNVNDATDYYVKIIREGLRLGGEKVDYISQASEIGKKDIVLTITPIDFIKAYLKRPYKQIHWFQGISPEEMWLLRMPLLKRICYSFVYVILEWFILHKSSYNFFVSKAAVNHFRKKYGYNRENYLVMPCFNSQLNLEAFSDQKYSNPTFVYAGSLRKWQCVEETLVLYKRIKERLPQAELYFFTKDKDGAEALLAKYQIKAEIRYVPYDKVGFELSKIKYGFLIRKDIEVNKVATPTKMNTYLANGVIPIFTDVIGDFKSEFRGITNAVPIDVNGSGIESLFNIEKKLLLGSEVQKEYELVFQKYYSKDYYQKIIKEIAASWIK